MDDHVLVHLNYCTIRSHLVKKMRIYHVKKIKKDARENATDQVTNVGLLLNKRDGPLNTKNNLLLFMVQLLLFMVQLFVEARKDLLIQRI